MPGFMTELTVENDGSAATIVLLREDGESQIIAACDALCFACNPLYLNG